MGIYTHIYMGVKLIPYAWSMHVWNLSIYCSALIYSSYDKDCRVNALLEEYHRPRELDSMSMRFMPNLLHPPGLVAAGCILKVIYSKSYWCFVYRQKWCDREMWTARVTALALFTYPFLLSPLHSLKTLLNGKSRKFKLSAVCGFMHSHTQDCSWIISQDSRTIQRLIPATSSPTIISHHFNVCLKITGRLLLPFHTRQQPLIYQKLRRQKDDFLWKESYVLLFLHPLCLSTCCLVMIPAEIDPTARTKYPFNLLFGYFATTIEGVQVVVMLELTRKYRECSTLCTLMKQTST